MLLVFSYSAYTRQPQLYQWPAIIAKAQAQAQAPPDPRFPRLPTPDSALRKSRVILIESKEYIMSIL